MYTPLRYFLQVKLVREISDCFLKIEHGGKNLIWRPPFYLLNFWLKAREQIFVT